MSVKVLADIPRFGEKLQVAFHAATLTWSNAHQTHPALVVVNDVVDDLAAL
jgi:hypothetical protein